MLYENYLKLGFNRVELNDTVELKRYGYSGFLLVYKINKHTSIQVHWMDLDKPELWIKDNHCLITIEQVNDLLKKKL
jgi:hypothetical protein